MTHKDFDKLTGKIVRLIMHSGTSRTVRLDRRFSGNSSFWYYCHDEVVKDSIPVRKRQVILNSTEFKAAEVLPLEEEIIWRIENGV
jgi:hypothetical protein